MLAVTTKLMLNQSITKVSSQLLTGMKVLGKYDGMHGLVANPQPNPQCTESNRKLDALYAKALPLAKRLILEYVAKLDTDEPLDAAYDHTFGEF